MRYRPRYPFRSIFVLCRRDLLPSIAFVTPRCETTVDLATMATSAWPSCLATSIRSIALAVGLWLVPVERFTGPCGVGTATNHASRLLRLLSIVRLPSSAARRSWCSTALPTPSRRRGHSARSDAAFPFPGTNTSGNCCREDNEPTRRGIDRARPHCEGGHRLRGTSQRRCASGLAPLRDFLSAGPVPTNCRA